MENPEETLTPEPYEQISSPLPSEEEKEEIVSEISTQLEEEQPTQAKVEEQVAVDDVDGFEELMEEADQIQKKVSLNSALLEKLKSELISLKMKFAEN